MIFSRSVPPKARHTYKCDAWAGMLFGVYSGWIFPFYLIIAKDRLHSSSFLISMMAAAPFVGNLLALLWANAMEGRAKKPFVVWSGVVARGCMLLLVFATTPLAFAAVVTVSQILATVAAPAYAVVMKDVYSDDHRGRIMGYVRVLMAFGMVVTTAIIGPLLAHASYRIIFPLGAIFGVASSLSFNRIRTQGPSREERSNKLPVHRFLLSSFGLFKENRQFRWFSLAVFTGGFGNLLLLPIVPVYQVDRLHITTSQAAVLTNIFSCVWMVSYLYWGRYVDRRCPLQATLVNSSILLLYPLVFLLSTNVWMLIPAFIVSGLTASGTELAYFNTVMEFSDERRLSQFQAIFTWLLGIRGTIAPFVGVVLKECLESNGIDYKFAFLVSFAIMGVGVLMQSYGARSFESRKCHMT